MGAFQSKKSYQVEQEEKKKGVDQSKRTSYKQDSPNTQQMKNEVKQNILKAEQRCSINPSNNDSKVRNIPKSNNPDVIIIPLKDYNTDDTEAPVDKQNEEVKKSDTIESNNIKEETKADTLINSNNQNDPHCVEKNVNTPDINKSKSNQKITQGEECKIQAVATKDGIQESASSHSKVDIVPLNTSADEIRTELINQEKLNTTGNSTINIEEEDDKKLDKSCVNKTNTEKDTKLDLDKIEVCNDLCLAKSESEKDDINKNKDNKKQEHDEDCSNKSEVSKHLSEKPDLDKIEVCKHLNNVKLENEKGNETNQVIHTEEISSISLKAEKQLNEKSVLNKTEVSNELHVNDLEVEKKDDYKESETHVRTESKGDIKFDVEVYTVQENASVAVTVEESIVKEKLEDIKIESIQQEKAKEHVQETVKIDSILNNQESKADTTEAKRKQAVEEIQNIIIASVTQGIKMEDINNSLDDSDSDKDVTTVIKNIENEVKIIKLQVEKFSGTADDKNYVELKDKLVCCINKLDSISIDEDNKLKNQKQDVIKLTQNLLDLLQDNIVQANIKKDKEEIGSDNVKK